MQGKIKAEGARLAATSTRQTGEKAAFCLLDGLSCDLEPLAPGARQFSNFKVEYSFQPMKFPYCNIGFRLLKYLLLQIFIYECKSSSYSLDSL